MCTTSYKKNIICPTLETHFFLQIVTQFSALKKMAFFYLISFITQIVNVIIILQKTVSIMHNT